MSDTTAATTDKAAQPAAAPAAAAAPEAAPGETQGKARAALRGVWGSFSALATRVVHAVESEAATLKSEQAALAREAAREREPAAAAQPPWEDLGPDATAEQRAAVARLVHALTASAANFVAIPVATQRDAAAALATRHAAAGTEATAAERRHAANVEEDPERDGFSFELGAALPAAEAALRADARLARLRSVLVPRRVSERNFWRNWLWRVAAIKAAQGVHWPTAGIALMKSTAATADASADAPADAPAAIEDEITLALTELDADAKQQQEQEQQQKQQQSEAAASASEQDDSWAREVEAALADQP